MAALLWMMKTCCLLALIAKMPPLFPSVYNTGSLCCGAGGAGGEEDCILFFFCFPTKISFTSALSRFHLFPLGLLCVFIATSKWPSPPCSLQKHPLPSFQSGDTHRGNYYYFPGCSSIPDMLTGFRITINHIKTTLLLCLGLILLLNMKIGF